MVPPAYHFSISVHLASVVGNFEKFATEGQLDVVDHRIDEPLGFRLDADNDVLFVLAQKLRGEDASQPVQRYGGSREPSHIRHAEVDYLRERKFLMGITRFIAKHCPENEGKEIF